MSTFIKSDQSAPKLQRTSPISRSGFVHPDQRVITGLTWPKSRGGSYYGIFTDDDDDDYDDDVLKYGIMV